MQPRDPALLAARAGPLVKRKAASERLPLSLSQALLLISVVSISTVLFLALTYIRNTERLEEGLLSRALPAGPGGNFTACADALSQAQAALAQAKARALAAQHQRRGEARVWFAEDKDFHGAPQFPMCTMDVCFDFAQCAADPGASKSLEHPLVYSYQDNGPHFFQKLTSSKWYTADPAKACLFLVFLDAPPKITAPEKQLKHWGSTGANHVFISFSDSWSGPPPQSIGMAKLMLTNAWQTRLRPSFDVSLPLPRNWRSIPQGLPETPPHARKYLATFMGTRYLGDMRGRFRNSEAFKAMNNGRDVLVLTHCGGSTNARILKEHPDMKAQCDADAREMKQHSFVDLMNSTFGLAPAGRQPATYRFMEILSAGGIPVLIVDNYKMPFDDIIQWKDCLLSFPTSEMPRVISTLRQVNKDQLMRRQAACRAIFTRHLETDDALLQSVVHSLQSHFFGSVLRFKA